MWWRGRRGREGRPPRGGAPGTRSGGRGRTRGRPAGRSPLGVTEGREGQGWEGATMGVEVCTVQQSDVSSDFMPIKVAVYSVQCPVSSVQCPVYSVQCTMYSV